MLGKSLALFSALALTASPAAAQTQSDAVSGGEQVRGDAQARSVAGGQPGGYGTLPARRTFYDYPRHRHIDGGRDSGASAGSQLSGGEPASASSDRLHGSPYYGRNYGAPYNGGGYYDGGVYYRERRD